MVTSVNARCHIYTRLIGPLLITPQLSGVIKPSRPRLVPRFYESLAELLVSQFMEFGTTSDFKAVSCPSRLVALIRVQTATPLFCCCDSTRHPGCILETLESNIELCSSFWCSGQKDIQMKPSDPKSVKNHYPVHGASGGVGSKASGRVWHHGRHDLGRLEPDVTRTRGRSWGGHPTENRRTRCDNDFLITT